MEKLTKINSNTVIKLNEYFKLKKINYECFLCSGFIEINHKDYNYYNRNLFNVLNNILANNLNYKVYEYDYFYCGEFNTSIKMIIEEFKTEKKQTNKR